MRQLAPVQVSMEQYIRAERGISPAERDATRLQGWRWATVSVPFQPCRSPIVASRLGREVQVLVPETLEGNGRVDDDIECLAGLKTSVNCILFRFLREYLLKLYSRRCPTTLPQDLDRGSDQTFASFLARMFSPPYGTNSYSHGVRHSMPLNKIGIVPGSSEAVVSRFEKGIPPSRPLAHVMISRLFFFKPRDGAPIRGCYRQANRNRIAREETTAPRWTSRRRCLYNRGADFGLPVPVTAARCSQGVWGTCKICGYRSIPNSVWA